MKIISIRIGKKLSGGNILRNKLDNILDSKCQFKIFNINYGGKNKIIDGIKVLYRLLTLKDNDPNTIFIRDYLSTITLFRKKKSKNILNIFHIDNSVSRFYLLHLFLEKIFYRNLKNIDTIVVMSKYWKKHFESKGHKDVRLVYCGFDMDNFKISDKEVRDFKKKHNLLGKSIVYLGNCQKAKGVVEAYNVLKDLDVHLVTSGKRGVHIPAINLDLSYKEYLTMLKASDIAVTMSKFKEGWCMVAHEAMLVKTPVIGSGKGGMAELLQGGKQIICRDFKDLRGYVVDLLDNKKKRKKICEDGHKYAKEFTNKKFERAWIKIIKDYIS